MSPGGLRFGHLADRILDAAAGDAEDAEAYFHHGTELTVRVFAAELESLTSAESQGVGLRVFAGGRVGFAHTSDLSDEGLRRLAGRALDACRHNEPDEHAGLPDSPPDGDLPGLIAADFDAMPVERRVELALDLDAAVGRAHPDVRRSSGSTYGDERGHVELHTTRGVRAAYDATVAYAYSEAIAERGEEMQSGFSFTYGRSAAALDIGACAAEAAQRAAALLGAGPASTRTCPVVFEPWAAASLIGTLAPSIGADSVQKGRSLLAGRVGEAVAAGCVTLVDDGRLTEGLASRPWDAEGVATQRTEIVSGGSLVGYLHDTHSARRDGAARSTGNASRSTYRSLPELAPSNLLVVPGEASHDELVARMGDGVVVTDVHGLHTVNPVTGEFSVGINGHLVEGGRRTRPIREMTVAGTLLGLLERIEAVGSDLRYTFGAGFLGAPSVLVRELALSGS